MHQEAEVESAHLYQPLALVSCRQTIASLQKLMGDLQKAQPQKSRLEQSAAEVVRKTCTHTCVQTSLSHNSHPPIHIPTPQTLAPPLLIQAQLRSQLASLEHALRNKEAEVESMMQTIGLKDKTIKVTVCTHTRTLTHDVLISQVGT